MIWMVSRILTELAAIVWLDVVLSGHDALVIDMASFMGIG